MAKCFLQISYKQHSLFGLFISEDFVLCEVRTGYSLYNVDWSQYLKNKVCVYFCNLYSLFAFRIQCPLWKDSQTQWLFYARYVPTCLPSFVTFLTVGQEPQFTTSICTNVPQKRQFGLNPPYVSVGFPQVSTEHPPPMSNPATVLIINFWWFRWSRAHHIETKYLEVTKRSITSW